MPTRGQEQLAELVGIARDVADKMAGEDATPAENLRALASKLEGLSDRAFFKTNLALRATNPALELARQAAGAVGAADFYEKLAAFEHSARSLADKASAQGGMIIT